jgi:hypothetical protein
MATKKARLPISICGKWRTLMTTLSTAQKTDKWLTKLYDMGTITTEDLDRERGRQYGYPKCCIEAFIQLNKEVDNVALVAEIIYGVDNLHIEYVRCPKCREGGYYDNNKH